MTAAPETKLVPVIVTFVPAAAGPELGAIALTPADPGGGVGVRLGVRVGVREEVIVGVRLGVNVGVRLAVLVGVREAVRVGVRDAVKVGVWLGVFVAGGVRGVRSR